VKSVDVALSRVRERHLWAETYERDLRDVLVLQDEVARAVVKEIRVQLLPEESSRLASAPSINRDAYELYLKGRYFWNKRDPESLNKALDYFQRASKKIPATPRRKLVLQIPTACSVQQGPQCLP
jgi:hypothetical protein